jgi:muramoyltetrapeptide carboxypeptidase
VTPLKPRALRPGDTLGVVAPASSIRRDLLEAGSRELEALGFGVRFREDIGSVERYLAGPLSRRIAEFHGWMRDPGIRGVICARGGYGSGHLLPELDLESILADPKVFCGASDITMLLAALEGAGLVVFHGPMVATAIRQGPSGYNRDVFRSMLIEAEATRFPTDGCEVLAGGSAEGVLSGGCLALIVSLLGTPWEPVTRGRLLVLEDIGCRPYQIDRMLTQLRQAGKLDEVTGFVFGEMPDCHPREGEGYTLQDVVMSVLGDLGVPIIFNFPTGHSTRPNVVVPFGVSARLVAEPEAVPPVFELLEPAVVSD